MPRERFGVQCLIIVDMQRAFVEGDGAAPQMPRVLPAARRQRAAATAAGALVVQLQNDGAPGAPDEPGSWGWHLYLEPARSEVVIRKSADSGFKDTNLHQRLRDRQIKTLSVCGVMSEMCVAATARDAMRLGYEVTMAHDSHGTYPVPPFAPGEPGVSAEDAARAAEWSLGDTISLEYVNPIWPHCAVLIWPHLRSCLIASPR